jgi:oligopeptide transport system substrate-binding protein
MAHDRHSHRSDQRTDDLTAAQRLLATFAETAPKGSRRDLLRWSAVVAGAAAGVRAGSAVAAPSGSGQPYPLAFQDGDVQTDVSLTIPFDPYGQPVILDPHRAPNWGPFWNLFPNVWGGLLRFDENGAVQLDLAESFAVSEDGRTYTFKIRPDARYATGNQVVAGDFITSWTRALDPSNPSPMAQFMELVEGYQDYINQSGDQIGFEAPDDQTVVIRLSAPANFFPSYLAAFVWSVIDPTVLGDGSDPNFPLNDGGTGPWRFTEFEPNVQIVMEPNTNHYGGNSPSLVQLVWSITGGQNADADALDRYRNDEVPLVDVPISLLSTVEVDPELADQLVRIENSGSTRSLAMDFNQPPFNDVRVRQALAHACDREQYASVIWEGTWLPTTSFSPAVLSTLANYEPPEGLGYDLDRTAQLLEEAGFPNGEGLPEITFYVPSEETDDERARWLTFFQTLRDATGFPITVDPSRSAEQIQAAQQDVGGRQLDAVWLWNVTETPHLITYAFQSNSPIMRGVFNWNADIEATGDLDPGADSASFDELVAQADVETDEAARNDLFQQAETLALQNAVYIPLGHWVQMFLQKSWLQGTKQGPWTGRIPVWFDREVVVLASAGQDG